MNVQTKLRPADVLSLWHLVSLGQVRDEAPDLTLRQMTILLTIYLEPPHPILFAAWLKNWV